MEKTMSVEERIRRAEDIYNRRNGQYSRVVPKEKINRKRKGNIKKMLMQIFICLSIYLIFYAVTNREYIFSEEFRKEVNLFFTEKTKIYEIYSNAKSFVENKLRGNNTEDSIDSTEEIENIKNEQENLESTSNEINNSESAPKEENQVDENIGGAEEMQEQVSDESKNDTDSNGELSEEEQMKKDANEIKSKISFIVPVNGRISSTFGWRNPTTSTVPRYHTGLDIAANEGTVIKSATDGKIVMASTEGDFGNHYQIQIEDVIIVYAHCKTLYLKEGDEVKQGQEIAEVGTTGNSTGPHLHFEIRKDNRLVDPQLILEI